ncbi:DNA ligase D [Elioraea sp.]|uniref:DNA ligase D n=1 Tax=Elioraea sp. TaxID=2185103 RepID=UPI0025C23C6B|nr:DNA ligase D [Elioraea sp.]
MKGALDQYRAKRDFTRTAEPAGARTGRTRRLRFVIQKHAATRLHYDLRLEWQGVLKSWAVTNEPVRDPSIKRLAVEVEDHPLDYARFEGTIPKGQYGGGVVEIWDKGLWAPRDARTVEKDLAAGQLKFVLLGDRMEGGFALIRLKPKPGSRETRRHWLLIKENDSFAMRADVPAAASRTTPREPVAFLPLQLCVTATSPPTGSAWIHELKLDGYRVQIAVAEGRATIRTRTGLDWTSRFPGIADAARHLPDCVMDGEAVAMNSEGVPDFALLQAVLSGDKRHPLVFFAFDLLRVGHRDLRPLPLRERKDALRDLLAHSADEATLRYTQDFSEPGEAILRSACQLSMEGVVSKLIDRPYAAGRSGAWVKAKCRGSEEVVIGGWSRNRNGTGLGALLVGARRDGVLVYLGRVGTGFGAAQSRRLLARLEPLSVKATPFSGRQPARISDVSWARPNLVAQVAFAGWTEEGLLRHASFIALREDKPPEEVSLAMPATPRLATSRRARLTNPERVLWPAADGTAAITKADLADYYTRFAPLLLAQLGGRPLSILRTPDGIGGERFFQRHATAGMSPLLLPVRIPGEAKPYMTIRDEAGLLALAQIAATELHPWGARADSPAVPDRLVFDLDPGADIAFDTVREAALRLRVVLAECGLTGFPRLSGGKGVHLVVALATARSGPAPGWPEAKAFTHDVCRVLERDDPAHFTTRMSKRLREGRIFLDYLRNASRATAIASWSPRARPGAPLARPLSWRTLARTSAADAYRLGAASEARTPRDPWTDLDASAAPLADAIKRLRARG